MRACEIINEKEILLMGGNAFKDPIVDDQIRRINRSEIDLTLQFIAKTLKHPMIDFKYLKDNLMGSAGKQETSGDLDVAMNAEEDYKPFMPKLVIAFPRGVLKDLANRTDQKLGSQYVLRKGIPGGQLMTAWPISGNITNGLVQVDFILGNAEYLKFSHYSPGEDVSPFGGVFLSTLHGLMAKMAKDFEYNHPETGERMARVGLRFDLEKGLFRQWELQKRSGQGPSKVNPDYWETNFGRMLDRLNDTAKVPRFTRIGYITNPAEIVKILYGKGIVPAEVDTFEKAWTLAKKRYSDRIDEMFDRLVEALYRSGAKYKYPSKEALAKKIRAA